MAVGNVWELGSFLCSSLRKAKKSRDGISEHKMPTSSIRFENNARPDATTNLCIGIAVCLYCFVFVYHSHLRLQKETNVYLSGNDHWTSPQIMSVLT